MRACELIITSPLGIVPRELERVYPAAHYDVPVTGRWDREELAFIASTLAAYLERHQYGRVIAHLDGGALAAAEMAAASCGIELERTCNNGAPADDLTLGELDAALDGEHHRSDGRITGILSWQFGCTVDQRGMTIRERYPELSVTKGSMPLFTQDPGTGLLRPTFSGWQLVGNRYRVTIDGFVPEGDVLAPGVVSADPLIHEGDEVLVENALCLATGRAAMPASEMTASRRGVAVRVRKVKRLEIQ
jgi:archaeosine synthase